MTDKKIKSEVVGLIELFDGPAPIGVGYKDLDEMLQYLRVKIKYALFDIEATRRESRAK